MFIALATQLMQSGVCKEGISHTSIWATPAFGIVPLINAKVAQHKSKQS